MLSRVIPGVRAHVHACPWHSVGLLCRFEAARAPGMYKDEYLQALFEYYHEERNDLQIQTPMLPSWKADNGDESPEHFGGDDNGATATPGAV